MDEPVAGKALWWTFPHAWQRCGSLALFWSGLGEQGKGGQWAVSHPIDRMFARQMFTTLRIPSGTETWISK